MSDGAGRGVLRLITRLNVGGPARQALLLTKQLAPEYQTLLAAGSTTSREGELSDEAVHVTRVPLVRALRPGADLVAAHRVRQLLRACAPSIVHTHMAKAGTVGRGAALSLGRQRPRLVHTFHGHVLDGYFSPAAARTFIAIERSMARRTDVLIAVSPQVKSDLLGLGIGSEEQYRVIPLGLELDEWFAKQGGDGRLRRHIGVAPEVPLVGVVGRLVPIKNVEMLLDVVRRMASVHLAVVGDGESRSRLEARAVDLGLEGRVHFVGWWSDVPGAMADLDVVALTSRNEGTPVSLIEALAARRPVVGTDVGGVPFVVEDGVTGLLVPTNDPAAFAERLEWALNHKPEMTLMAAEGSRRVRARFSSERLVKDIKALYDELLD